MHIECLPSGPFRTNTYLLLSSSSDEAVIVDPAPQSARAVMDVLRRHQKTAIAIWITHSHWDHIADCHALLADHHIPVMVHRLDAENLVHPGSDGIPSWGPIESVAAPLLLKDGEQLRLGQSVWNVVHTPGHSPGSVCFYNAEEGILLSGDTLFRGTMGNVSFPTSSPSLMGQTLEKLASLPPATRVLPGHGLETTIEAECSWMRREAERLRS